jgi:cytochrome c biogenesis protein CcmG/thiol:disulfide interchange protein DsbE
MTVRQQWMVVAGVLTTLAVALATVSVTLRDDMHPVDVGSQAPDFTAHVVGSAATRSLADYKGAVVLVNLWATWCEPCREEMPSIERLYQTFARQGFKVLAVSVDQAVGDSAIARYARDLGLSFDVLHDSTQTVAQRYLASGYPETFIIDRSGMIRRKWIGPYDWDSVESRALISELLGIKRPAPGSPDPLAQPAGGARGGPPAP